MEIEALRQLSTIVSVQQSAGSERAELAYAIIGCSSSPALRKGETKKSFFFFLQKKPKNTRSGTKKLDGFWRIELAFSSYALLTHFLRTYSPIKTRVHSH